MQNPGIGDTDRIPGRLETDVTNPTNVHLREQQDPRAEYAALVRGAAAGDADAMERLLMRAQEAAYRVSLLVCGHPEDAEDVMQDALMRTYRHVGQIGTPEAFRTWLYTTVRNACLMRRRRRVGEPARHVSIEQDGGDGHDRTGPLEIEAHGRTADDELINAWVGGRLRTALGELPDSYRAVVVLREIEGLSTREVAGIMQLSEANVKTRLHRARAMLRERLGDV
jgi:RNA polymerase sigma-70 factor (ECF subfamily)